MTWTEVADTAIKLGLGAVIAGVTAFLTSRHAAQASLTSRRRDLIERVLALLNEFERGYRNQKAVFDEFEGLDNDADRKDAKQRFDLLDEAFRQSFEKFVDASNTLLLLGETKAANLLDDYRTAADQWYEKSLPELAQLDKTELDEIRARVQSAREALFESLSVVHKRTV